jgi:hypothetical protein
MRPREDYGPIVRLRTQFRLAPWLVAFVVLWGYCTDHHVHNAEEFLQAVAADISTAGESVPRPGRSGAGQPPASADAKAEIPRSYLALYQSAARSCPGLPWTVIAGIGRVESNHGRSRLPGVRSGQNFAGAAGPMQMGNGTGKAGNAWARYGRGGNIYDPHDAIPAATRMLCADGARGGRDVRGAVFAYNCGRRYCSVSVGYVRSVYAFARRYQKTGGR